MGGARGPFLCAGVGVFCFSGSEMAGGFGRRRGSHGRSEPGDVPAESGPGPQSRALGAWRAEAWPDFGHVVGNPKRFCFPVLRIRGIGFNAFKFIGHRPCAGKLT